MADTFSNDLRLRLQESGSNAGTWGDLLNGTITNIASALGQGSEAIPNASTHTITLADGTADEARSLYLKCTGGGQACTVTLGPNTISKVWIIDNTTSYTLTFRQGSGATVAIAAGAVKVIATDGAGSGAAVVDTLDGLEGALKTLAVNSGATTETTAATIGYNGDAGTNLYINTDHGSNLVSLYASGSASKTMRFLSGTLEVMRLGTTGNVGIGASSPSLPLHVKSATTGLPVTSGTTQTNGVFRLSSSATSGIIDFGMNGTNPWIQSTGSDGLGATYNLLLNPNGGNVGIGTSSPQRPLHVNGTEGVARFTSTASGNNGFEVGVGTSSQAFLWQAENSYIQVATNNAEAFRITAARDMYFGQTSGSAADVGHIMQANGVIFHTADGAGPLQLRRLTSDGPIAEFKINASLIGVIAGHNGDLHIGTGTCGVRFLDGDPSVTPYNPTTGANADNTISLGRSNVRYTVVYATTGAINTSDRNLKQDIEELSDAEKRVAVAAKGLLRKFRWKDAVETKGDNARIHFGIIAQDLQDAFTAEGLDAARYGMWCSDTFTDEDTGEERTRLGVRYSELLAFIISAL